MKSIRLIVFSGISLIVSSLVFAETKPAVTIEVSSINEFTTELISMAGKLSPQTPAAMLPAVMGMPIKNPNLIGIDRTKPFQIQVFLPETTGAQPESPVIAILLPVLDGGKAYLNLLSKSVSQPIEKNGIKIYRSSSTDAIYIKTANDYALVCHNEKGINAISDNIKISHDSLLKVKGTLRIGITPQSFISYLKQAQKMATMAIHNSPATSQAINPQEIVNTEFSAFISAIKQIDHAAIGIKFNDKSIDINSRINPIAGSTIAKISKTLKTAEKKYQTIAPANSLYAGYGTGMDSFNLLIKPYTELIEQMYHSMGTQMEKMSADMIEMLNSYRGTYAGNYAMGIIPINNNKLGFYEVLQLNNAAKAKSTMMKQYTTCGKSFSKNCGIEININTNSRVYKNTQIISITYKSDETSTNVAIPTASLNILSKLTGELAYINNDMIYTYGGADVMNIIIDRLLSNTPKSDSAQFTKLLPASPKNVAQSYIIYPAGIIKSALSMIPGMNSAMLAGIPQNTGGMAGYTITDGKDIIGVDRISTDDIIAIKQLVPIIQSMAMGAAAQMQMAPPPTTQH